MATTWNRVTRSEPCPICKHPDWCLIDKERTAVICPRVESPKKCGEAGWLHRLTDTPVDYTVRHFEKKRIKPGVEMSRLNVLYVGSVEKWKLDHHAAQLGLSSSSMVAAGVGYAKGHKAWSFPMRSGDGEVIGIRLRREDGSKFAVRGSRNGLFLPTRPLKQRSVLFIVEGPTDLAAMIHLGFEDTIGLPFNRGGSAEIRRLLPKVNPVSVVIIADADGPGMTGALELTEKIGRRWCRDIIRPPGGHKDIRKYLQAGGDTHSLWRHIHAETEA